MEGFEGVKRGTAIRQVSGGRTRATENIEVIGRAAYLKKSFELSWSNVLRLFRYVPVLEGRGRWDFKE